MSAQEPKSPDGPFHEVAREAEQLVNQGHIVYQKWTCAFCGERVTMSRPNVFFTTGHHEECKVNPDGETDVSAQGCNYILFHASSQKGRDFLTEFGQTP